MRVSAVAYAFSRLPSFAAFEDKILSLCYAASLEGVQLVVFPEYISMELASLFAKDKKDIHLHLGKIQDFHDSFLGVFQKASSKLGLHICAGSFPVKLAEGCIVNRSYFFSPSGKVDYQDKIHLTRFEKQIWGLTAGETLKVFDCDLGKLAINICYDSEFSYLAHCQAKAGARVLIVPSCTEGMSGYQRVKIGCSARALENQMYVVQCSTIGQADWCESIDENVGGASIFCPPDHGLPETGLLAGDQFSQMKQVYVDLDLHKLEKVRNDGQVLNLQDHLLLQLPFASKLVSL